MSTYADTHPFIFEASRSAALGVGIALVVQTVAVALLRSLSRGSAVAAIALLFALDLRVALIAVWCWLLATYLSVRGLKVALTKPALVIMAALLFLNLVRVASSPSFDVHELFPRRVAGGQTVPGDPDIFLVMLDGYPRSDTLAEMDYDHAWFDDELEERGFSIADNSTSSYPYTFHVLTGMFSMEHVVDLTSNKPESHVEQVRVLSESLNQGPVMTRLAERGYHSVSAGLTEVRGALRGVDEYVDYGELRLWERQLLQRTSVGPIACELLVIPQHRSLIESTFTAIEETASATDDPVFMFAHVMSPHTPIVFGPTGEPIRAGSSDCWRQFHIDATLVGLSEVDFASAMADQVHYLNHRTIQAIDQVLEARPDAVVILFSDHGARYSHEIEDEWFRNFLATRTPGHPELFARDARPIDIFPSLFNAYFGDAHPMADTRKFRPLHGLEFPLELEQWAWNE